MYNFVATQIIDYSTYIHHMLKLDMYHSLIVRTNALLMSGHAVANFVLSYKVFVVIFTKCLQNFYNK